MTATGTRLPPVLRLGPLVLDRQHRRPVRDAGAWILDTGRRFESALLSGGAAFQDEAMGAREDVLRMARGEEVARPGGEALRRAIAQGHARRRDLLRIIDGWQLYFVRQRYRDWCQLETMALQLGGASAVLLGRLAGAPADPGWAESASRWGAGVLLAGLWTRLDASLERGRLPFPEDDMERMAATARDFADGRRTKGVQDLLWFEFRRARDMAGDPSGVASPLAPDAAKLVRAATAWSLEVMRRVEEGGNSPYDGSAELGRIETARLLMKA